jgi:ligand-binding SRPBCC domain-containing protein
MHYYHRFVVNASQEAVRAFHSRSASMRAITPPPILVQVHEAPELLEEGSTMTFTLWMGPLPLRWKARMSNIGPGGFVDTMERGPFETWVHEHAFVAVDETRTEVIDSLHIVPSDNWFWWAVGQSMILGMPVLFGYRQWRTRRLLEGADTQSTRILAVSVEAT